MTTIHFDNSASIFGHVEAISFKFTNESNGYFDAASGYDVAEIAERIRAYLVRNCNYGMLAGDIRYIADYFGELIINTAESDESAKAMSATSLMAVSTTINKDEFKLIKVTVHFVTARGSEYLSINNYN